jgi:hypothetical protein
MPKLLLSLYDFQLAFHPVIWQILADIQQRLSQQSLRKVSTKKLERQS